MNPSSGEHPVPLSISVVVSPVPGRLRILTPRRFTAGREWIDAGQPIARVDSGSSATPVVSAVAGPLGRVFGLEGELVEAGQVLAWIERS